MNTVPAAKVPVVLTESNNVTSISAFADRTDAVSYPKVFACETTLDRRDALSRNISFASMFILKPR